jgi:hypothetical protein
MEKVEASPKMASASELVLAMPYIPRRGEYGSKNKGFPDQSFSGNY